LTRSQPPARQATSTAAAAGCAISAQ
jgi:hypothetical protein